MNPQQSAIELKDVRKAFGTHEVLKRVNLRVTKGENLVILGKSGTGKSVIIKCIVNLITPDSGEVRVLGQPINRLPENELRETRKKIGFLFQSGALYDSMSVRENLEFPLRTSKKKLSRDEIEDRVTKALKGVKLESAIDKMPSELSGGMRKRVGLARTLMLMPEVMLYDEPTTGLDSVTSREISELIRETQAERGVSSIIITHDLDCAKRTADRIAVLKEGEFVEEGSYESIQKSQDPWIRSFFT